MRSSDWLVRLAVCSWLLGRLSTCACARTANCYTTSQLLPAFIRRFNTSSAGLLVFEQNSTMKKKKKKYAVSNSKSNGGPSARLRRRFSRGGDQSDAPTVMWPA
ncbi:Inorganic pyrophosphatase [Trichinella spiralis]|uniref:Inorganic pyrophosphatase n=1 Tax=Trichinella spiralis TaxID=6334 RepID=A0ABR3KW78_TRISP